MSRITRKPAVSRLVRKWTVQPGMSFAVVEDREGRLWIEESCPIGTHYWTVEQAAQLALGCRTQPALDEAIAAACDRSDLDRLPALPAFDGEPEFEVASAPRRGYRTAANADSRLARV
jgi:hypothetical protein